ncbi:MAG: hypothetical protein QM730_02270 [Anaerolineales bacterium]
MNILVLKLILAPVIIGSASLAGRKWGPAVSGWIVGMPLTSGPVIFFVALSHDANFAYNASLGTLSGGFSLVAFCLVYAWLALRFNWVVSTVGSLFAYGAITAWMQNVSTPFAPLFIAVFIVIVLGIRFMPKEKEMDLVELKPGRWDIPSRILIGTSFILLLTGIAPFIGPRLTGLLSTIPLYTAILTIYAHRLQGGMGAVHVLRGLLHGLFAFLGFFITLCSLLPVAGIAVSFISAIIVALLVQGGSLVVMNKRNSESVI